MFETVSLVAGNPSNTDAGLNPNPEYPTLAMIRTGLVLVVVLVVEVVVCVVVVVEVLVVVVVGLVSFVSLYCR